MGRFIHALAAWSWYCTLTYRDARHDAKRVEREIRRWADGLARDTRQHVSVAIGVEPHLSGALHAHALVAFESATILSAAEIGVAWRGGFTRIERFDRARGASWYLAKTPLWGIVKGCPRSPRCRRRSGCRERGSEVPIPFS